jgi:sigma-B regulation protein RsbU (phosphoserine phosphatase)
MCRAVGGDYYDYVALGDGRYGLGLGDVAGKGLPSALLMASFQASLRALSEMGLPPDDTIRRLNRLLCRSIPENRFVTFFYAILDPATHEFTYVNAGQNPPYIVRAAGGTPERLDQSGPPLALLDYATYVSHHTRLERGDVLVCYSDGVSEARGPSDEEFGEIRLTDAVAKDAGRGAPELVRLVTEALQGHCAGRTYQDDVTLVVLKRKS